jgi:hypothetical protein
MIGPCIASQDTEGLRSLRTQEWWRQIVGGDNGRKYIVRKSCLTMYIKASQIIKII